MTRSTHSLIAFVAISVSAVTMHAGTTTIVAAPSTVTLSYTKGVTPLPAARVIIGPSAGTTGSIYFTLNSATLPVWLQVDRTNGSASTAAPITVTFSPSLVAANSPAGFYSAGVEVDSGSLTPVTITVSMTVTNTAPTVTSSLQILPSANWTPGTSLPTGILTVKSSGDPVFFTASTAQTWITLSATSDVAYSWGTNIIVTFAQSVFDNPVVNSSQTGTITVKSGSQTISNPVSISIGQPVATITSTSPKQLPQVIPAGATRTIAIQGGSFVQGMNVRFVGPSGPTVPYNCTTFATVTTDAWCLQSSTQFFLKLSSAALLGAAANGSQITVYLSAGIPAANGSPPVPGQTTIQVVTTPIVSAVTDAASFMQPVPGQPLNVAPYEMLSIFGDNFGTPGANTGVGFNQGRLLSQLTDTTGNALNVHFTDGSGSALPADSDGFLLLWTPTQINVLAPSAVIEGQQLKATVSSGGFTSTPDPISTFTVAKANPGLLTIGGTQAVAVNVDNSINSSTNPARFGQTIVLYLSGMGAPRDGTAVPGPANAGPLGSGLAACADLGLFQAAATLQHSSWLTIDGAVIDNAILGPYAIAPCFDPATVSVKLGNLTPQAGWVAYAGFTEDSIAGLYQVNIAIPLSTALSTLLPAAAATATAYPIQVSINGAISQAGVNVYLAK